VKAVVIVESSNCFTCLDDGDQIIDKPLRFLRKQAFDEVTIVIGDSVSGIYDSINIGKNHGYSSIKIVFSSSGIIDVLRKIDRANTEDGILFIPGDCYFTHPQTTVSFLSDHSQLASVWVYNDGEVEVGTGMCFLPSKVFDHIETSIELEFFGLLELYFKDKTAVYQIEGSWFDLGNETVLDAFITWKKK